MEPNAGTNGIVAPDGYWPRLREETRERGVYLIADEVMSGFGRCGEWFAWQRHGEAGRPDLMTLAKGLTGAHLPLGAVVLSAEVAARLEHERLADRPHLLRAPPVLRGGARGPPGLRGRGPRRALPRPGRADAAPRCGRCRTACRRSATCAAGHGLFAVVELVRDRATREPVSPWPATHPSLERARPARPRGGRLVRRPRQPRHPRAAPRHPGGGPPERPRPPGAPPPVAGVVMTFKLTYSTMFDPPGGDARPLRGGPRGGARRPRGDARACTSDGADVAAAQTLREAQPGGPRASCSATSPSGDAADVGPRDGRGEARPSRAGAATPPAERVRLVRRVSALLEERVYTIGAAARPGGRQEPHGGARRDPGDRRLLRGLRGGARAQRRSTTAPSPTTRCPGFRSHNRSGPEALRRLGGDHALQLPAGPRPGGRSRRRSSPATRSSSRARPTRRGPGACSPTASATRASRPASSTT